MVVEDASEEAWVRRVREGEPEAFEEVFGRHRDELWTLVSSVCPGEEVAAELLRETAMEAWTEAARAVRPGRAWLQQVCARVLFRQARNDPRPAASPAGRVDVADRREEETGAWPSPDLVPDRDGLRRAVKGALARLALRERIAWALSDLAQMPASDIAREAQETLSSVRQTVHRARLALREELEAYFTDARHGERSDRPAPS